jgi:FAD/FMN-containing dehydrogenase
VSQGAFSRRSFLKGAGASAGLVALDGILRRHGGAEAAALRSRIQAATSGEAGAAPTTWQNWSQNLSSNPERVFRPRGRQGLIDVVRRARNEGKKIRVTGSSHSFSPLVPTDEFLVYNRGMRAVSVDKSNPDQPLVTVESGADGADALAEMGRHGVALPTNVVLQSVTYGGLIAAGCHGSGWDNPTLSDLVESMDIIDAAGTVRTYSESAVGTEVMNAARLNLGLFGLIDTITLRAVPTFNVRHIDMTNLVMTEVLENLEDLVTGHDYVDLFWWPFNDRMWVKTYDRTTEPVSLEPGQEAREKIADLFGVLVGVRFYEWLVSHPEATPAVSRSLFNLLTDRDVVEPVSNAIHYQDYIERLKVANTEFAIPVTSDFANVRQAWQTVVEMTDALAARGRYPFNLTLNARFIRNSEALLSPAFGNEHSCFIEVLSFHTTPGWERFSAAVAREWMKLPGARPHWPKEFQQIPGIIPYLRGVLGDNLGRFLAIREELGVDPDRMFVNPYLNRVLFA